MTCPLWARHWVVAGPDQTLAFWVLPAWWDEEQHAYLSSSEKVGPSGLWGRVGIGQSCWCERSSTERLGELKGEKYISGHKGARRPTSQLFWEWIGWPHNFWNEAKGLNWTRWTWGCRSLLVLPTLPLLVHLPLCPSPILTGAQGTLTCLSNLGWWPWWFPNFFLCVRGGKAPFQVANGKGTVHLRGFHSTLLRQQSWEWVSRLLPTAPLQTLHPQAATEKENFFSY